MEENVQIGGKGYTIVELMVTIVIVAVLAVFVGNVFVKLLNIQEREREEAYVRETLADICGSYADMLSVGSSLGSSNLATRVKYRWETGGVSLETGLVSRVMQLTLQVNSTNKTADVDVDAFEFGSIVRKLSRIARGDASLLPLPADIVSCTITPLDYEVNEGASKTVRVENVQSPGDDGFMENTAALGYLEMKAQYKVKNDDGEYETKDVNVGRVVRLWNRQ